MKLLVSEIIDFLHGIGPMYNSPDFVEVLKLTDQGSFTKVFKRILERSLSEYELKSPLFMWDKSVYSTNNNIIFTDNYDSFLNGKISEEYIELVPTSVVHYTDGLLKQYRDFTYVRPKLKIPRNGRFKISYFAKYPTRFSTDKHKDEFTDDAHIYGIDKDSGADFTYLMYFIEYNLLIYLRDQKAQMTYVDLPIEFYNNLDTRLGELLNDIQDWYNNPVWYSKLLI